MISCQCQGIEELFNDKSVRSELERYRAKGPSKTTRMLVDALISEGVRGSSLLDIGGGVGAIQHALLAAGAASATDIDASQAYIHAAEREAGRRGLADRIQFQHGNFVDLAPEVSPADIVTLDRVVCCYDDMDRLVDLSAARTGKLYGLVYPRDAWWVKFGMRILNFFMRLFKNPYRSFVHPSRGVEALVNKHGLKRRFYRQTPVWQVVVYARDE